MRKYVRLTSLGKDYDFLTSWRKWETMDVRGTIYRVQTNWKSTDLTYMSIRGSMEHALREDPMKKGGKLERIDKE